MQGPEKKGRRPGLGRQDDSATFSSACRVRPSAERLRSCLRRWKKSSLLADRMLPRCTGCSRPRSRGWLGHQTRHGHARHQGDVARLQRSGVRATGTGGGGAARTSGGRRGHWTRRRMRRRRCTAMLLLLRSVVRGGWSGRHHPSGLRLRLRLCRSDRWLIRMHSVHRHSTSSSAASAAAGWSFHHRGRIHGPLRWRHRAGARARAGVREAGEARAGRCGGRRAMSTSVGRDRSIARRLWRRAGDWVSIRRCA